MDVGEPAYFLGLCFVVSTKPFILDHEIKILGEMVV